MFMARTVAVVFLIVLTTASTTLLTPETEAATPRSNQPATGKQAAQNKFARRWKSQITLASGEVIDDGIIDITDAKVPDSGKVIITHSRYAGSYSAYTLAYPDRIEIQIPLGEGRIAHYNGVLVSSKKIQGHFFVTEDEQPGQSHHSHRRRSLTENNRTAASTVWDESGWTAEIPM